MLASYSKETEMTSKSPSLRQIAQGLGVSHSLLSLWRQGKRTLKPEIEARYWAFVTNSGYRFGDNPDTGFSRNTQVELEKFGTEGRSRAHTGVTPMDFESVSPCNAAVLWSSPASLVLVG